ncbi:unnamed protein product [Prorocentrum cordatum]|uniref:Uncharacterized protein n=1 Tax=Prorocentrum cordatum TaxID=2364126 RepID=A0ABN9QXW7_9DINO|nr:unnamed protein product [Polarella glacialis]
MLLLLSIIVKLMHELQLHAAIFDTLAWNVGTSNAEKRRMFRSRVEHDGRRGRGDGPRPRLAAGRRWQERRRRRRRACGAGGHGTSQARRPAPSAGMGSAARAGAARALEEARRAAKETVFLWAAFWRSSRQRGKRCPSLVARHGAIRRPGGVSSRSCLGNLDLLLRRDRPAGAGRSASASARWRARASISFCSSPPPPPAPPSPPPPGGLRGNRHLP